MLNVYDYHNKPESLDNYENKDFTIPSFAYDALINDIDSPDKLRYERAISNSAEYSLKYAQHTKKRFPLGEHKIAQDGFTLAQYIDILTSRAPELEPDIFKHVRLSVKYLAKVGYFDGADKMLADNVANTVDPSWKAQNMKMVLSIMNNVARKRSQYIDALLDTNDSMLDNYSDNAYQSLLSTYKKL